MNELNLIRVNTSVQKMSRSTFDTQNFIQSNLATLSSHRDHAKTPLRISRKPEDAVKKECKSYILHNR